MDKVFPFDFEINWIPGGFVSGSWGFVSGSWGCDSGPRALLWSCAFVRTKKSRYT